MRSWGQRRGEFGDRTTRFPLSIACLTMIGSAVQRLGSDGSGSSWWPYREGSVRILTLVLSLPLVE